MSLHKEIAFEDGVCGHLSAHHWLYEAGAADRYDRPRALFVEDLAAWVQESQPGAWATLEATNVLADRLRAALDKQGTLHLLRNGLDVVGLKQSLYCASSGRRWA
jgi:type I restriction enzyme R subunit